MQERLHALKRRWQTDLRFAFRDSRLFEQIDSSIVLFEPPAASLGQIRAFADQMLAVLGLVE